MSTRRPICLTQDQIDQYHEDGYLIVHNLLAGQEIAAFLEREARTRPPRGERGLFTHREDPQWEYLAKHPNVAGIVSQLLGGMPKILQTMYMPKAPASGEKQTGGAGIAFHQDTHYLPNEPNTLMACWIAMNDTDAENGGLCVVPGSHRGPLHSTHLNVDDDHVSWEMEYLMRDQNGREWKQQFYSFQIEGIEQQIVALTVPRGSGVFFTGMTIHGSYANRSRHRPRLAFAVHYVKDGTWVYRADVQNAMPVTTFSTVIP